MLNACEYTHAGTVNSRADVFVVELAGQVGGKLFAVMGSGVDKRLGVCFVPRPNKRSRKFRRMLWSFLRIRCIRHNIGLNAPD